MAFWAQNKAPCLKYLPDELVAECGDLLLPSLDSFPSLCVDSCTWLIITVLPPTRRGQG